MIQHRDYILHETAVSEKCQVSRIVETRKSCLIGDAKISEIWMKDQYFGSLHKSKYSATLDLIIHTLLTFLCIVGNYC